MKKRWSAQISAYSWAVQIPEPVLIILSVNCNLSLPDSILVPVPVSLAYEPLNALSLSQGHSSKNRMHTSSERG